MQQESDLLSWVQLQTELDDTKSYQLIKKITITISEKIRIPRYEKGKFLHCFYGD